MVIVSSSALFAAPSSKAGRGNAHDHDARLEELCDGAGAQDDLPAFAIGERTPPRRRQRAQSAGDEQDSRDCDAQLSIS